MDTHLTTDFLDSSAISSLLFHPHRCDAASRLVPLSVPVPGAELGGLWFDNPVAGARENFKASAASEKRLVEIPGAGHNDLIFKSRLDGSYFGAIPFVVEKKL